MKFTATIMTAVLGFTSAISALPTKSMPTDTELIPEAISIYHVSSGQIEYAVSTGRIQKYRGSGNDLSTLMTFYFPEETRGKKCSFNFETDDSDYYINNDGGVQFDVFYSNHIVTQSYPSWPGGNQRGDQVGRLEAIRGGKAVVVEDFWPKKFVFDCPAGEKRAFELVPTGEEMSIAWNEIHDGAYISY